MHKSVRLEIGSYWNGDKLAPQQVAVVTLRLESASLIVKVDAPFFGNPPPMAAAGPTDRLWEHEVVELFLADAAERYFELELGPHKHHLALTFDGVRQRQRALLPIDYRASITWATGVTRLGRFHGEAQVPREYLPEPITRANAYAIHGVPAGRCYHAHAPVPGEQPDFHRLECFVPIAL